MKKTLSLLIFIFLAISAFCQTPQPSGAPNPNSSGYAKYAYMEATFLPTVRDTFLASKPAVIWHTNGNFYKTPGGAGSHWSLWVPATAATVSQVNTNASTGIIGGPITTTGTVAADTLVLTTRARTKQIADSIIGLIASSGGGTVLSVSVVDANGISGTVANSTSTPAITLIPYGLVKNGDTAAMLAGYKDYYPRTAISGGSGISYNPTTGVITNSSPSSDGTVVEDIVLFTDSLNSLNNFTQTGTSFSASNGILSLGNATGIDWSKYILANWNTSIQQNYFSLNFKFTNIGAGAGMAVTVIPNIKIDEVDFKATATTNGTINISLIHRNPDVTYDTSIISGSVGDDMRVVFYRNGRMLTANVYNVTTGSTAQLKYIGDQVYNTPSSYIFNRTGKPGIYNLNSSTGTMEITSFQYNTNLKRNQYFAVLGESITEGEYAGNWNAGYLQLLQSWSGNDNFFGEALGGNFLSDYINAVPELLKIGAKNAIIYNSINNATVGTSSASYNSQLNSLISMLTMNGVTPIVMTCNRTGNPAYNTYITAYNKYVTDTLRQQHIQVINADSLLSPSGHPVPAYVVGDSIHLSRQGDYVVANLVANSLKNFFALNQPPLYTDGNGNISYNSTNPDLWGQGAGKNYLLLNSPAAYGSVEVAGSVGGQLQLGNQSGQLFSFTTLPSGFGNLPTGSGALYQDVTGIGGGAVSGTWYWTPQGKMLNTQSNNYSGGLQVSNGIVPSTDNTDSLGVPSYRWKYGYFGTNIISPNATFTNLQSGTPGTDSVMVTSSGITKRISPSYYATSSSLTGYLPLTGGTLTGQLNGTSLAMNAGITTTTIGASSNVTVGGNLTVTGSLGLSGTSAQYVRGNGTFATFPTGITGLTTTVIPKATSSTSIGDGQLSDNGTSILLGSVGTINTARMHIVGQSGAGNTALNLAIGSGSGNKIIEAVGGTGLTVLNIFENGTITTTGNIQGASITSTGGVTGTIMTASQPNITTLGTLTTLSTSGTSTLLGDVYLGNGTGSRILTTNRSSSAGYAQHNFNTGATQDWGIGTGVSATGSDFEFYSYGTNATQLKIAKSTGAVTIANLGTGTVQSTSGTLSVVSDSRDKIKLGKLTGSALAYLMKIPLPESWEYNKKSGLPTGVRKFGLFADSVHYILGEQFAPTQKNGHYGLDDNALLALTIQALQEEKKQKDAQIKSLTERLERIEKIILKK